jgi:hypothetical protein
LVANGLNPHKWQSVGGCCRNEKPAEAAAQWKKPAKAGFLFIADEPAKLNQAAFLALRAFLLFFIFLAVISFFIAGAAAVAAAGAAAGAAAATGLAAGAAAAAGAAV